MNGSIICLFLAVLALTEIRCASVYGTKEDAKQAIKEKKDEFDGEVSKIDSIISAENDKIKEKVIKDEKKYGEQKKDETWKNFDKAITEAIKQAIMKDKPVSAVDCIIKVAGNGRDQITETRKKYDETLDGIVKEKKDILGLAKLEANLIDVSLKTLIEEANKKLDEAKTKEEMEKIQKIGVGSCNTALKQVRDIQSRLTKPNPTEQINNAKNGLEKTYKDLGASLYKKLQKCLS